jgi:hypothetical protein
LKVFEGANGMKTGFTNQAGHTLIASATRNGRTLIAVVLNTWDTYGWAAQLLDQGFATAPTDKGTGQKLPPVRVSPYGQRLSDRAGFLALTRSGDTAPDPSVLDVATTTTTNAAEAAAVSGTTVAPTTVAPGSDGAGRSGGSAGGANAAGKEGTSSGGGPGLFSVRNLLIAFFVLLAAFVLLRRRAVRRQRARRLAARRATATAMRRGALPVVDGRYRTGTRVGPPVESHVRIHRGPPRGRAG